MRNFQIAAATVMALSLAACGSDSDPAGESAPMDEAEVAEQIEQIELQPGQYQTSLSLVEFDFPGVDGEAEAQMRDVMAQALEEGNSFCLTPDEAAQGPERMLQELAEADCTFTTIDVSGGNVDAQMACVMEGGEESRFTMSGTYAADGSSMRMSTKQDVGGQEVAITMQAESKRTGECV
ncbi:DUF3617 domain-containing protein [Paraurantiacibacter namhicola]|uniref:DUF3617 domain-containing protein n=1 Tax=Paraurantiacibacter namhicola TaxID=645517 RepID=A0A1C7D7C4_9SPHN|nr:DUF3617 domain-containing protein [Paraurantiacibacter namhicola]ANU07374.1 hypothetical protein A6F65_01065 [Paraurantiacibacter namhicola]